MLAEKIEKHFKVTIRQHRMMCSFIANMINNESILLNEHRFFQEGRDNDYDKYCIDKDIADRSIMSPLNAVVFEIDGVLQEIYGTDTIEIRLPLAEEREGALDVSGVFKEYITKLVRAKIISDLQYTLYSVFVKPGRLILQDGIYGFVFEFDTTKYTYSREYKLSRVKAKLIDNEDLLKAEIAQGYINEAIGDPNRDYGYTHLLRQHAGFKAFNWFKTVLTNWKKINVVVATRGQGKTYDASFIGVRALLNKNDGFGGRPYREIKYFTPDKTNIGETFFKYCKALIGDLADKKYQGKKIFKITESKYTIECLLTGNILQVVSLYGILSNSNELGKAIGEGLSCDDAIIDEATRIPNIFWDSFYQRAIFETQNIFVISTANEETPSDHWAYQLLLKGEMGDETINSKRVTIDENELLAFGKTEEERLDIVERLKEEMRNRSLEELYARAYCVIFNRKKVFNIGGNILTLKEGKSDDFRVITLDPAKLDDNAGITVININTQFIEEEINLVNAEYTYQLTIMKELKEKYKNSVLVCDRNGVGELVIELDTEGIIDVWIKTAGTGELSFNKKKGYYSLSKSLVIGILENALKERLFYIGSTLVNLIEQMNNFERLESKSGRGSVILYKGKGKTKDDLVLSAGYGIVYIYSILGLRTKDELKNYGQELENTGVYMYNDNEETFYNPYY